MKAITITLFFLIIAVPKIQGQSYADEIKKFQNDLDKEFLNPEESPLPKKDRKKFKGHNYFPVNEKYRVKAKFTKTEKPVMFQMKTTTDRLPAYDEYGVAEFQLDGIQYKLYLYQSHQLRQTKEYENYLFLPFTDLTNGAETYGGGRYIDLTIPTGDEIIIDFNKAYSPSCAYDYKYSCPIPPAKNHLNLRVEAGVKNLKL